MISRPSNSHKGQNGKVCVIGGSETFHGAPIFASLGVEATGVDLVYPIVPPCHIDVTKNASYNFICSKFYRNYLSRGDITLIKSVLKKCDVLLIGPGLGERETSINTAAEIIESTKIPVVVDADGLCAIAKIIKSKSKLPDRIILTPHLSEFTNMTMLNNAETVDNELIKFWAKRLKSVILLKGETDIIYSPQGKREINQSGNAGLTVGGTGDTLSGIVAGLIALGKAPFEAAFMGAKIIGTAGDVLVKEKGHAYTTMDVIEKVPYILKNMK